MGIWFWAVLDCFGTPADRVRRMPKIGWLILLFVFWWAGAVAWFWFGRPAAGARTDPWRTFSETARVPPGSSKPPIGPDDDPDFLGRLG
jgi:hypothetical protein